jgi:DNA repair protein RadD
MSRPQLHPHQTLAIDRLRDSIRSGHRCPVLQAPTAFGKTVVASNLVYNAVLKGKRVMITVPRKELVKQTAKQLWDHDVRHVGILQGDHPMTNPLMPVQVATVQTLANRKVPDVDIVLVDECHIRSAVLDRLMADPAWRHVKFIGLSATPWRKGMGKVWDDLVIASTTADLIEAGFLSPFETYAPLSGIRPDLSGVKTVATAHGLDFQEKSLADAMAKPVLMADAVASWKQLGKGRPTLVFAVNCAHAKALQEQFCNAGIFAEYIDGKTPDAERESIKLRMERREVEVCVSIGCLTTGCDWPFVSCIQLCRPTKSEILYTQIIGRGLRLYPGKENCLILDHTDTWNRLGEVTDIHHDQLDDGSGTKTAAKPKREEDKPKECPKCHRIKPARTPICPNCGFEAKPVSKVATAPGVLEKVTKKAKVSVEEKQRWYSMLLGHTQRRGMKDGWAYHKFKEKFGVYPSHQLHKIGLDPDAEVNGWITSRNIAWAKSRHNGQEARP